MPMKLLWRIGIVVDIDDDTLAFLETQQRAGELAIVGVVDTDASGPSSTSPVAIRIV